MILDIIAGVTIGAFFIIGIIHTYRTFGSKYFLWEEAPEGEIEILVKKLYRKVKTWLR